MKPYCGRAILSFASGIRLAEADYPHIAHDAKATARKIRSAVVTSDLSVFRAISAPFFLHEMNAVVVCSQGMDHTRL
jgi:hypothetical protein